MTETIIPNRMSDLPPQLRWERPLATQGVIERLQTGLLNVGDATLSLKPQRNVTASILTAGCFKRAQFRTNNHFDPGTYAHNFLEETDYSGLFKASAYPEKIDFLKGIYDTQGARVALFFRSTIEDEQRIAHNLLLDEGLADKPFLSGAHISLGTFNAHLPDGKAEEVADYLFSLVPDELLFKPITQQYLSADGSRTHQSPLAPIERPEAVTQDSLTHTA